MKTTLSLCLPSCYQPVSVFVYALEQKNASGHMVLGLIFLKEDDLIFYSSTLRVLSDFLKK